MSAVISENRNAISQTALDMECEWVLYLDDDHHLPGDTLMRLLAHDVDIVSAHYTQRQPPFNPVLMEKQLEDGSYIHKQLSSDEHGLIQVEAAGAGCLLVKTEVLKALEQPFWRLGQIHPAHWGDDLDFCTRVRKLGFKVYCDLDVQIGHYMTGTVTPQWDETHGWMAAYRKNVMHAPIAQWPMPLAGD
jgi:GT2 family glycosyltransferase